MRGQKDRALRGDLSPLGLWFVFRPLTGKHPEIRRWHVLHVPTTRICAAMDRKRDAKKFVEEIEARAVSNQIDIDSENVATVTRRLKRLGIEALIEQYSDRGW